MTFADSRACGKSFVLSVTMKSAAPVSAHAQNGASSGSGSDSIVCERSIVWASSRKRLTTPADDRSSDVQPSEHFGVLADDLGSHQPHKRISLDPASQKRSAWILDDGVELESGDARHEDRGVDDASRPRL